MGMLKLSFQRTSFLETTWEHILNFQSHKKHLSIGHLNTLFMVSSFDEFHVMLQEHPFDILTLSETRLKEDVNLLKYVQIPGC